MAPNKSYEKPIYEDNDSLTFNHSNLFSLKNLRHPVKYLRSFKWSYLQLSVLSFLVCPIVPVGFIATVLMVMAYTDFIASEIEMYEHKLKLNIMSSIKLDDIGLPIFYTIITHPLTHARTLMQLGYEPAPKYLGHSLLSSFGIGKKVYKYPSIFTYCKYIRNEIGLMGVFTTGLTSRIMYWNLSSFVSDMVLYRLTRENHFDESHTLNTDGNFHEYLYEVRNLTIARSMAVVVAYPFQVFMIRQMAEIMNSGVKDSKYLFTLFLSIIDDEGILGLYGGLRAKLIGEILTIWLTSVFVYTFNKYVLKDRVGTDIKNYTPTLAGLVCSNLTYRFSVISTVMAIAGSKISGAIPFNSMWECYAALNEQNAFARGSSLFLRYAQ